MEKENISGKVDEGIKKLCVRVEETLGLKARTPKHFEQLSELIFRRTGELLSPTTLKRIWGYLKESTTARQSTLDVLARCCGWHDYEDFLTGDIPELESGFVESKTLNPRKDLRPGQIVRLLWSPARVCDVKYRGNDDWTVIRATGTRLSPGDTFTCPMMISGEPLYLDNLTHAGSRPGVYVCGRKTGVRFAIYEIL